jgi:ribosome-associated heat shock protein Hsp15
MRVDKWLWMVRVFKTRSLATDECRRGKVELNGRVLKPSQEIQPGDNLSVYRDQLRLELKVLAFPQARVGAKVLELYMQDLTPPDLVLQHRERRSKGFEIRARGAGRPTKRQRRDIDRLKGDEPG